MSDDVKPQPERPDVGRVGVCSIGYLGVIAGIGDMPWGEAWVGTGVVTGAPWSSRTPVVLSKQDEAWVLTLAERLRAAEALAARWMTAALRSASTLGVAFDPNSPEAWMDAQTAFILREIERRKTAEAELAAAWAALEEMRWPDLPGVPFYVKTPDGIGKREIPASEVVGIFDALRTHARALLPFGVAAVESHYAVEAIKAENARLREHAAGLDGVRRFVGRCIADWDWQHDIDGGDVQEWALRDGLLEQVEMPEPCGDSCQCAELVNDFPMTCYRLTQIGHACRDTARAQEANDGTR